MVVDRLTYTISEAAQAIGIGRSTIYKLINEGELPIVRLGKRVLIPRASILELLRMEAPVPPTVEPRATRDPEERTYLVTIRPTPLPGRDRLLSRYP